MEHVLSEAGFTDIEVTGRRKLRGQSTWYARAKAVQPTLDFLEVAVADLPTPILVTKSVPSRAVRPKEFHAQEAQVRYQVPQPKQTRPPAAAPSAGQPDPAAPQQQ